MVVGIEKVVTVFISTSPFPSVEQICFIKMGLHFLYPLASKFSWFNRNRTEDYCSAKKDEKDENDHHVYQLFHLVISSSFFISLSFLLGFHLE